MKKTAILFILLVPMLTAGRCDDESDGVDANSPQSLCDHIFDLCGGDMYENDKGACQEDVASMDGCRKECVADQDSCEPVDQCLWWNLGYDGEADNYCSAGDDGGNYSSLDECATGECSSQYSSCNSNSDCSGIFNDCLDGCSDWDCVELCANVGYPGGIDDFNTLWTCLNNSCSDFM
jgi:hypothetical protein